MAPHSRRAEAHVKYRYAKLTLLGVLETGDKREEFQKSFYSVLTFSIPKLTIIMLCKIKQFLGIIIATLNYAFTNFSNSNKPNFKSNVRKIKERIYDGFFQHVDL